MVSQASSLPNVRVASHPLPPPRLRFMWHYGSMNPSNQMWSTKRVGAIVSVAVAMQAVVWALMYLVLGVLKLGYWFFFLADSQYYFGLAGKVAAGSIPYRDFMLEYPPLFVPLLVIPRAITSMENYVYQFAALMVLCTMAAAVVTALTAHAQDASDERRPFVVAALFALAVLASGSIVANRYDAVVALVFAACLLLLVRGRWEGAAAVIGLGFALKITPVFVLPIVLILAPRSKAIRSLGWFGLTAVTPFAAFALMGGGSVAGLMNMLQYHTGRPLEIESVLGAPLLVSGLNGLIPISIYTAAGSQNIAAPGAELLARSSVFLVLAALGVTYWLVWRRRDLIRAQPRLVPFALLVAVIVSMTFSKVFSPQYFIWTLPALALVALDRKALGALIFAAIVLTQIEFPANYSALLMGDSAIVSIVVARNILVVIATGLGLWQLWKLPAPEVQPAQIPGKGKRKR